MFSPQTTCQPDPGPCQGRAGEEAEGPNPGLQLIFVQSLAQPVLFSAHPRGLGSGEMEGNNCAGDSFSPFVLRAPGRRARALHAQPCVMLLFGQLAASLVFLPFPERFISLGFLVPDVVTCSVVTCSVPSSCSLLLLSTLSSLQLQNPSPNKALSCLGADQGAPRGCHGTSHCCWHFLHQSPRRC